MIQEDAVNLGYIVQSELARPCLKRTTTRRGPLNSSYGVDHHQICVRPTETVDGARQ